jgi:hypothetical protein
VSASAFYAYVGNDPTDKTDPTGQQEAEPEGREEERPEDEWIRNTETYRPENRPPETPAEVKQDIELSKQLGLGLKPPPPTLEDIGEQARQSLHRPYVRQDTRDAVEKGTPRDANGRPIDPNTGKPIQGKPDLGHKPGREFRTEKAKAEAAGKSQKEFNNEQNDPNIYQQEDPSSNRSHRYECKSSPKCAPGS